MGRAPSQGEVGDLLRALAGVYWPIVVLLAAVLFRHEIVHLAERLQEATFGRFGFKFFVGELEPRFVTAGAAQRRCLRQKSQDRLQRTVVNQRLPALAVGGQNSVLRSA